MDFMLKNFQQQMRQVIIPPAFGEPRLLPGEAIKIKQKYDVEPKIPNPTDLNQFLVRIRRYGIDSLKRREIRWLPWILHFGSRPWPVEHKEFLQKILSRMKQVMRTSYLNSLIHVYLKFYDPDIEGTEKLRRFIHKHLINYNGNITRIKKWKNQSVFLFSDRGAIIIAQWLYNEERNINSCIEKLGFTGDLSNAMFLKEVVKHFLDGTKKILPENVEKPIDLLEMPGESSQPRFPVLIPKAASVLLTRAGVNVPPEVQDILRPFFLRHLNDPRLPGGQVKWRGVIPDAIHIFNQWLSKKDLEFFFNVVDRTARDPKWKYRHKFWEAYIPYIENTWVVLGRKAKNYSLYSSDMKSHMEDRKFGILKGGTFDQSVFLIEMRGYVFVEWSHEGACRIWHKDNRPFKFGEGFYSTNEFRGHKPEESFVHRNPERYKWQEKMRRWIRDNAGIYLQYSDITL